MEINDTTAMDQVGGISMVPSRISRAKETNRIRCSVVSAVKHSASTPIFSRGLALLKAVEHLYGLDIGEHTAVRKGELCQRLELLLQFANIRISANNANPMFF